MTPHPKSSTRKIPSHPTMMSPADKGVYTTHLSQLSEQTPTVQLDESVETSSQVTVTDSVQHTEKEQNLIIIFTDPEYKLGSKFSTRTSRTDQLQEIDPRDGRAKA